MSGEAFVDAIRNRAEARFAVESEGRSAELEALAPDEISDPTVVRLRRRDSDIAGWRTFLVAHLGGPQLLPLAQRWAAEVRDRLLEPETADLYLLAVVDGLSEDDRSRIEADEQFCRKLVAGPKDRPNDVLDRSFLAAVEMEGGASAGAEPLAAALAKAASTRPWLDAERLSRWHQLLASGRSGLELASALYQAGPPVRSKQ